MKSILQEALSLQDKLVQYRRDIHVISEVGMETHETAAYVMEALSKMGYKPEFIVGSGVLAILGGQKPGPVVLLRADMDALPIVEEAEVSFCSTNGHMHACGHDLHTAMLLGAAELLKEKEDLLEGTIKLLFQPGEETLEGAKAMIRGGILDKPKVDRAMMVHVASGFPLPTGCVVVPDQEGPFMAASDAYHIQIQGKGGHGAMPETTIDPLNIAAHTHIALQAVNAREASRTEPLSMTIGMMSGGCANNVIPDTASLSGTIRTFSKETQGFVHKRIKDIAEGTAQVFGGSAQVTIDIGTPAFIADGRVSSLITSGLKDMLEPNQVIPMSNISPGGKVMGAEDFAFISQEVPSTQVTISAGNCTQGYVYPLHHPKVRFDEKALAIGAAVYCMSGLTLLEMEA